MAAAAELYARLGWSCFPADANKQPLISWRPYSVRRPRPDEMSGWAHRFPGANIAVAAGPVSGNLVILDADGKEGVDEIMHRGLPKTPIARTPRGGMHVYFEGAGDESNCAHLGASGHIDVRAKGGYVLAPHSRRKDGRKYEWMIPPGKTPLAKPPVWFRTLLDAAFRPKGSTPPVLAMSVQMSVTEMLSKLSPWIRELVEQGRPKGHRSEADMRVLISLLAIGADDDSIRRVFEQYPIGDKYQESGEGYLERTLEAARKFVKIVRVQYADLVTYDHGGQRVHLCLRVEESAEDDLGRTIRAHVQVGSVYWRCLLEAAAAPEGSGPEDGARWLKGKMLRIQMNDRGRAYPVAGYYPIGEEA